MRTIAAASILGVFALAACGKPGGAPGGSAPTTDAVAQAPAPASSAKSEAKPDTPHVGPSAPMLAYAYEYGIEAPTPAVAPLMRHHEAACRGAGPDLCQVVGASSDAEGGDRATAKLQLRAEPRWLEGFRARLDGDARAAGGRLLKSAILTEDLTRQIIDTDAAIRARTLLRGRLEQLLATRPGKLSELIELEQELARVQGEIDAAQSEVAVMRTRVAMSALTLSYDSRPPLTEPGALRPLTEAARAFLGHFAESLAAIVNLIALLLPFGLLAALVAWVVLRLRPRRSTPAVAPGATKPEPPLSHPAPPATGA